MTTNRETQHLGYTLQSDKKPEPKKILAIIDDDKDSQMSRLICYLCLGVSATAIVFIVCLVIECVFRTICRFL